MLTVSSLSFYSLRSQYQPTRARAESMFMAGTVIDEARLLLSNDKDIKLRLRLIVGRGCDLLDQTDRAGGNDPPMGPVVACRLECAAQREKFHEDPEARANEAIMRAGVSYRSGPVSRPPYRCCKPAKLAEYLARNKDVTGTDQAYQDILRDAQEFEKTHIRPYLFARFVGEASGQIGDILLAKNDRQGATAS